MAKNKPQPKPKPKPVVRDAAHNHSVFSLAAKIEEQKRRNKAMLDSIN